MNNFIRGTVLGLAVGMALFWYGGISDYFPAIVATMIFIGVLIPMENQEKQMTQLLVTVREIRDRLESLEKSAATQPVIVVKREEEHAFIPTFQPDMSTSNTSSQKKRTVDRSLEDVAKKLSSMPGQ